jgi:hypothetical protein
VLGRAATEGIASRRDWIAIADFAVRVCTATPEPVEDELESLTGSAKRLSFLPCQGVADRSRRHDDVEVMLAGIDPPRDLAEELLPGESLIRDDQTACQGGYLAPCYFAAEAATASTLPRMPPT